MKTLTRLTLHIATLDALARLARLMGPLALVLALATSSAHAEPRKPTHCVKGIPCGNACIARDRVCHKLPAVSK